jgi:hypothetical protein
MDIFQNLLNTVRAKYKEADKATGGWLPGGGVASPLTRAVFPPQPFPKRAEELSRITGVKARFIDPEKTPSVVRQVAPVVAPMWGKQDYSKSYFKRNRNDWLWRGAYTFRKTNRVSRTWAS